MLLGGGPRLATWADSLRLHSPYCISQPVYVHTAVRVDIKHAKLLCTSTELDTWQCMWTRGDAAPAPGRLGRTHGRWVLCHHAQAHL